MHKEDFRKVQKASLIFSLKIGKVQVGIKSWQGDRDIFTLKQIHSSRVFQLDSPIHGLEGDAIITQKPGFRVGVRTADCVPVAILGKNTVAVIHAGWRGLRDGIIEKSIEELCRLESLTDLKAFVGPSAKACCYEVGTEFKDYFESLHFKSGKLYMDTQQESILRLKRAGIENFFVYRVCTICHHTLPSYRRNKTEDRLVTFIEILDKS